MTVNRGRGWRRIGIVLSVIWFVGFGGCLCIRELNRASESFGAHLDSGNGEMGPGGDLGRQRALRCNSELIS
jgi:hypothetical protein